MTATANPAGAARTAEMRKGRQADSARRRQRVMSALEKASADGTEISVSGIARAARSTAPSSTGTGTCWRKSTPSKPPRHPPGPRRARRSP
ncbi:MAG: hypothetical protein ACRDPY_41045, partial [Streptosporangiaceae bacterium]